MAQQDISQTVREALSSLRSQLKDSSSKGILQVIPIDEEDRFLLKMKSAGIPNTSEVVAQTYLNISLSKMDYVLQCCMNYLNPIQKIEESDPSIIFSVKFI